MHADAERAPFADASFDLAISEHGAICATPTDDPKARSCVRRQLLFFVGGTLLMLCYPTDDDEAPAETTLHRPYFGMHRFEWHAADGHVDEIEFHLGYGDMIRLLRSSGFEVEDLIEMQAPEGAEQSEPHIPVAGRRWPSEGSGRPRRSRLKEGPGLGGAAARGRKPPTLRDAADDLDANGHAVHTVGSRLPVSSERFTFRP